MVALVAETEKAFGVPVYRVLRLMNCTWILLFLFLVWQRTASFLILKALFNEHAWQLAQGRVSFGKLQSIKPACIQSGYDRCFSNRKIETSVVQDGSGNDYVTRLHQPFWNLA